MLYFVSRKILLYPTPKILPNKIKYHLIDCKKRKDLEQSLYYRLSSLYDNILLCVQFVKFLLYNTFNHNYNIVYKD